MQIARKSAQDSKIDTDKSKKKQNNSPKKLEPIDYNYIWIHITLKSR